MLTIAFEKTLFHERVEPSPPRRDKDIPGADKTILATHELPFGQIAWILFVPLPDMN